jgi:hypothetical protein
MTARAYADLSSRAPLFLCLRGCCNESMTDPLKGADIGDAASVVRAEWRADEEEWTRAGLERWRHERSLLDLLRECMHRGDTIALSLSLGTFTFTGCVIAVGVDLVTLNLADGPVDVCCNPEAPLVVRVTERARSGGTRGDAVTTFRARLLELEMSERDVAVGVRATTDVVRGKLVVGRDHVIVHDRDGIETVVGLAAVAWVRRPTDDL